MDSKEKILKVLDGASRGDNVDERPVAVVTGAGRGIGRALVNVLLSRGYRVVAVVRQLKDVRDLFQFDPENVYPVRCDVREPSTESILHEFIESQIDRVDVLINNAGFGGAGFGIEGLKYEELEDVLNVHLYGSIRCVRACLPFLRKSPKGTILNVSSRFASLELVATGGVPNEISTYTYRIAKGALNMLTSCLGDELKADNIRVLAVDPGKVKTRFAPKDADLEPEECAGSLVDLIENNSQTATFLDVSGEKMPW